MSDTEKEERHRSGDRLRVIRAAMMGHPRKGLAKFARQIGTSPGSVKNAETGDNWLPRMQARKILLNYQVPTDWLYFGLNQGGIPRERRDELMKAADLLLSEGLITYDPFEG